MNDDFSKYETMRDTGASPEDVYREAVQSGVDTITQIRLIRAVYSLAISQAKQVIVRAEGQAESLDQLQNELADRIASRWPADGRR